MRKVMRGWGTLSKLLYDIVLKIEVSHFVVGI